jgi:serine/threonine protein kinase
MAELFAARRRGAPADRVVAIKRILPNLVGDQTFCDMFLDEARIAATLRHPNIVRVEESGSAGGQHYMVMEYLRGRDLGAIDRALRQRGERLPLAATIAIIRGAAAGLHHAHQQRDATGQPLGIVHRDVSPRNVFVTDEGTVKVLDFGIVKARDRLSVTRTGTVKGKFPYMSPEAILEHELDHRADVFSLGILLWELTTGQWLFAGPTDYHVIKKILHQPIPRPQAVAADCPPALEAIILRALARVPRRRHPSAKELAAELGQVAAELGLDSSNAALAEVMARDVPEASDSARVGADDRTFAGGVAPPGSPRTLAEQVRRSLTTRGATSADLPSIRKRRPQSWTRFLRFLRRG